MKELESAWNDICKLLFGEEIGSYTNYSGWLSEMIDEPLVKKSSISGKEVIYSTKDYSKNSKSISLDEIEVGKKFQPLNINEIKDIDSIVEAIQDRVYYTGNIILGNSKYVESSSNINDSFYVYNTTLSGNSKYMAYCTLARLDTHGFGGNAFSQCEFCLKCHELTRVKRSFELWMSQDSSDCYYSHGLKNCSNCIFSFNLENKRYTIGNLELAPEKYKELKSKLVSEMLTELKKEKRLPSLPEIVENCDEDVVIGANELSPKLSNKSPTDRKKIDEEFSKTIELLLKKKPSNGIDSYALWLARHVHGFQRQKSVASGKDVFLANYGNYSDMPKNRLLTLEEAKTIGQSLKLTKEEVGSLSLKNAHEKIGKIAFFNSDIQDGQNINNLECTITIDAAFCYRSVCSVYSKYCAYSFWPRSSQNVFGCDSVFDSAFCINCYHSVNLQRCLEMDSCNSCSDSYFCHNCENLQDSMFCFNTKNKKYAIGNSELGKENYMKIKENITEQIFQELEKNGKSKHDIFSLDA
ncbi:MAG: hypothetical protein Q7S22_06105 [Candidatus Micrarchaeota archaeon]|nr:hypothetical protein [Candidatus Micrarchaeota archaeon]